MDYIETLISIVPDTEENREILTALLAELDYDSFAETADGIKGYIRSDLYNETKTEEALAPVFQLFTNIEYQSTLIKDRNWNEEWEKNYSPIIIENLCRIRAPFHKDEGNFEYDIVVEPKMSFGTGHHATTTLMMQLMLAMDFKNKPVLDMGCGTGVLAILAALKGANPITAIDIDEWAYENTLENAERNQVKNITVLKGNSSLLTNKHFEIILANINRNILLNDMEAYNKCLIVGGRLLLSGFYSHDLPLITEKAEELGFIRESYLTRENWVSVCFKKND